MVAVADGTVFSVGWNAVGGWRLWLEDAKGNDFYYAHLSGYTKLAHNNNHVRRGQVLGFVGNTGDAFTTIPHLHFEVHPFGLLSLGYDGAVDPTTYLAGWQRPGGVDVLPPVPLPSPNFRGSGSLTDFRRLLTLRPLAKPPAPPADAADGGSGSSQSAPKTRCGGERADRHERLRRLGAGGRGRVPAPARRSGRRSDGPRGPLRLAKCPRSAQGEAGTRRQRKRTNIDVDPSLTTVVPDAAAAGQLSPADATSETERIPLGQLLVAEGLLDNAQLNQALDVGSQTGERLGEVVVRQGLASEEDIARLLAEQWDLSYVDRASIWFDANALARLSREDAQRLEAMPTRVEDGRVVVAVAEPTEQRLAALREVIGEDTVVVVVPKTALTAGIHSQLLASDGRSPTKPAEDDEPDVPELATYEPPSSDDDDLLLEDDDESGRGDRARDAGLREESSSPSPGRALPRPWLHRCRRSTSPARRSPQEAGTLAQSLAQLIETQIGAARESSVEEAEKFAALERRIEQLEDELRSNRKALEELSRHFQAIVGVLGKL